MYPRALRLVVVSLQMSSMVCLLVLLLTPASKHTIVKALVVATILRSLFDVIPPLIYERSSYGSSNLVADPSFTRFCIADAIILRYFTVVKAAFAIVFTVPCLGLAIKHSGHGSVRQLTAEEASHPFSWRAIILFCIGPFVWALPAVFIPLHKLVHNRQGLSATIQNTTTCCIDDSAFQIVSLILLLIPLVISIIAAVALVYTLCQYCYGYARQTIGWQSVHLVRFAALIATTIISATLYTIFLVVWVRYEYGHRGGHPVTTALATSTVWEAISPWTILFIFGAREEVYGQWMTWLRKPFAWCGYHSGASDDVVVEQPSCGPDLMQWGYGECERIGRVVSRAAQERTDNVSTSETTQSTSYEAKIADDVMDVSTKHVEGHLQREILRHITSMSSMRTTVRPLPQPPLPGVNGLPLPPSSRPGCGRSQSPREAPTFSNLRGPPLDTGRNVSTDSTVTANSHESEHHDDACDDEEVVEPDKAHSTLHSAWYSPTQYSRPTSSGSTGTFGNLSTQEYCH